MVYSVQDSSLYLLLFFMCVYLKWISFLRHSKSFRFMFVCLLWFFYTEFCFDPNSMLKRLHLSNRQVDHFSDAYFQSVACTFWDPAFVTASDNKTQKETELISLLDKIT